MQKDVIQVKSDFRQRVPHSVGICFGTVHKANFSHVDVSHLPRFVLFAALSEVTRGRRSSWWWGWSWNKEIIMRGRGKYKSKLLLVLLQLDDLEEVEDQEEEEEDHCQEVEEQLEKV